MKNVIHLVKKEYIQIYRDRAYLPMLFIAPILQLTLFGYIVASNVRNIPTAILDNDKSKESRQFIEKFINSGYFHLNYYLDSDSEMDYLLDSSKIRIAINIPKGFSSQIKRGETTQVQFIVDGTNSVIASIIIGYTNGIIQKQTTELVEKQLSKLQRSIPRIDLRLRVWYNPELDNTNYIVPGIICTILAIVTTMLTSASIVREREKGTLEQLMVSPIARYEMILGKILPFMGIGFIDVIIVLAVGTFWFKVPFRGNVLLLLVLSLLFLSNTLGSGILISTISRTQQQALMTSLFVIMPWIILSGFVFPIENMPLGIQYLTYLIPLRYFLIIIREIVLKGSGLSVLWPQALAMVVLGGIILSFSIFRFNKRLE
ncbi:ABC transporter permease [Candidatus Poribacteria bacterium]|nr:ABC transporter permease [Candidatus Poribacteria bacterium]